MKRTLSSAILATLAAALFFPAGLAADPAPASAKNSQPAIAWQEKFDHPPLGWVDPFGSKADRLATVYSVQGDASLHYLSARYDGTSPSRPPAMHYGKAFQKNPPRLAKVRALRWSWRAVQHPNVTSDPWLDCAASIYVIIRQPSFFHGGRGYKFAWLKSPGQSGKHQHGITEIELRHDPATREWHAESVDLCALYKQEYGGSCEGESVLYVGVMTDGDNTRSISAGDYKDFQLELAP